MVYVSARRDILEIAVRKKVRAISSYAEITALFVESFS